MQISIRVGLTLVVSVVTFDWLTTKAYAQSVLCSVSSVVTGVNSTACGAQALVNGNYGVASGFLSSVTGNTSSAYGAYSVAGGDNAVAIGAYAKAANAYPYNGIANATAIGANTTAVVEATANGASASATGTGASAFGYNASASAANSVAIGSGSIANVAGTVSIGSSGAERRLVNLAAGTLSASSTDAVNGSQLYTVTNAVAANTQDILSNTSAIAVVNGRFALASQQVASGLGGGAAVDASGYVTAPNYSVLGGSYNNVGGALTALSTRVSSNSAAIAAIGSSSGGGPGLVVQDPSTQNIMVAPITGGTTVDFTGTSGLRRLTGVASGTLSSNSTDAVTGGQLYATNVATANIAAMLGGGAQINSNGTISAPSYTVLGNSYTSVAGAISAMDAALIATTQAITQNTNAITQNNSALNTLSNYNTRLRYASINSTGRDSMASGRDAVAFGSGATSSGLSAVAVGVNAVASQENAIAMGNTAQATGVNAIAIGAGATATGSVALGVGAQASNGGAALGDYAVATGPDSAALGPKSRATVRNAVAIGAGSVATEENVISVGAPGNERRITNVAAGITSTDAVNLGQLNDTSSRLVADIARIDGQMSKVRGGVAMAMAMGGGALPNDARMGVAVNVGTYGGQTALGVSHYLRLTNAVVVSGSVGLQDRQVGGRAGLMAAW